MHLRQAFLCEVDLLQTKQIYIYFIYCKFILHTRKTVTAALSDGQFFKPSSELKSFDISLELRGVTFDELVAYLNLQSTILYIP